MFVTVHSPSMFVTVHEIETKLNMKRTGYHGHAQRLVSTEP